MHALPDQAGELWQYNVGRTRCALSVLSRASAALRNLNAGRLERVLLPRLCRYSFQCIRDQADTFASWHACTPDPRFVAQSSAIT